MIYFSRNYFIFLKITFYNFRYYLVLPWFVFYFKDIPSLNSTSVMGMRVSSKAMPYLMGLQVILGSASNTIMAVCCIVSKKLEKLTFTLQKFF